MRRDGIGMPGQLGSDGEVCDGLVCMPVSHVDKDDLLEMSSLLRTVLHEAD